MASRFPRPALRGDYYNDDIGWLRGLRRPLEWHYTLEVDRYARSAGDLVLLRPRVLGTLGSVLLEAKEPRAHPIEFDAPVRNTDVFEITLPAGYARTAQIRELSVPVTKADALRQFFRVIA